MVRVLRPREVGRDLVWSEDMRGLRRAGDAPGTGAASVLLTRVDLPPPIGIHPRLAGVLQHILQRHPVGPTPRQRPLARALSQADPQSNVVLYAIA
jgi:hypothetical protein